MGRALTIETFELIIALPNEPTARLQVDTKDERINEVDEMIEIEEVVIGEMTIGDGIEVGVERGGIVTDDEVDPDPETDDGTADDQELHHVTEDRLFFAINAKIPIKPT